MPTERDFLQEKLSTSLQLHVTAGLIGDGVYWRRCCEQRWDICDVSCYDHSWKRMFLERHMEELIELFIPNVTDPMTVLEMVTLCGNYVKRLEISQLLPPVMEPKEEEEEEESGLELEGDSDRPSMDHFDFSLLLHKLSSLEELHLMYQVKQCGMNFEWTMFEMSDRDCESLAKALKSCQTLKVNIDLSPLLHGMLPLVALILCLSKRKIVVGSSQALNSCSFYMNAKMAESLAAT